MDSRKKKKLEEKGWKVGSEDEFLGLGKDKVEFIELKLALAEVLQRNNP